MTGSMRRESEGDSLFRGGRNGVRPYFRGSAWMNRLIEKQAEASFHDGDGVSHHHQLKQVAKKGAG